MSEIVQRRSRRPARIAILAGVVIGALALSACSASGEASTPKTGAISNKDIVIDFANGATGADTYDGLESTLKSSLAGTGAKLNVYNNNGDATTTFQNVATMVAEKPDVIVEVNPVADASTRLGQQLKSSGIPCIAVNVPIPGCYFFNQDAPPLGKKLASVVADYMKQNDWTWKNTDVFLVGTAAYGALNSVLSEFYAPLSSAVPGATAVKASSITAASTNFGTNGHFVNTDYTIDAAFSAFAKVLQQIPADKNIIVDCLGDELCFGARQAISQAGRTDHAVISAWGATPQAIGYLRDKSGWTFETANFFSSWGEFVAPMALAVAKGVKPAGQTVPPTDVITSDNVDTIFNPDGTVKEFPPLPESAKYLLDQGILQKIGNVQGVK